MQPRMGIRMSRFTDTLHTQRFDDYRYYHQSRINQTLHLISAVIFLACYALLFRDAALAGLVDRVVPDTELWNATMDIARTISGNAPLAIKAAKITIAQVLKDESQRDLEAIKNIGTACMDSEDFREGRRAFMEKRKPKFSGR